MENKFKITGYTLIELLVALSIVGVLFTVGFASYREFAQRQTVIQTAKTLKEDMRLAQQKALSGEKPLGCTILSGWAIAFPNPSEYTIQGACSNGTFVTKTLRYPQGVTKTTGPAQILFKVLSQGTDVTGTTTITLTLAGTGLSSQIIVTSTGEVR